MNRFGLYINSNKDKCGLAEQILGAYIDSIKGHTTEY